MPDNLLKASVLKSKIDALVFAAAAACLNRQDDVLQGISAAFKNGATTQEVYEAILQTYLFAGFPAALEGLITLKKFLKDENISFKSANHEEYDVHVFKNRGEILCRDIYTSAYEKMRARVGKLSPELDEWMIVEGYGKTLSRGVLKTVERELIIVGMLAALGWKNQLFSHIRGAMNAGASEIDCADVLKIVSPISPQRNSELAADVLKTVLESFKKV
jgi:4-carboxymuconolactone decarboxylase